jgi:hypothetical protein
MDDALIDLVWERAEQCCEYCQFPAEFAETPFQVDHIIPRKHGGPTEADNLALACFYCNTYKGPNLSGIDRETGEIVPLFHPRKDTWRDHFRWEGPYVRSDTPTGRATIAVLNLNHPDHVIKRDALIAEGVFPPS